MKEPVKETTVAAPVSIWDRAWEFCYGPTPISPHEKMAEIEGRMKKLHGELETECDMKRFDLNRKKKDLAAAANKGDESKVREVARECVRMEKLFNGAETRRNKAIARMDMMQEMRVGGQLSSDTIEYMQCHNKLMAKTANPLVVKNTTGQFVIQGETMKLCEEMIEEALHVSEDEEKAFEDSQAVEALVKQTMSNTGLSMVNKLPSITGIDYNANNNKPASIAKNIQQHLERK